ncbi:calcium-binding protein [Aestuariibius insulae]|uniref:calcium-binding protein n=1 Tax=Aestuariibius insulae TaxID=2058287 RepID=UPI00345E6EC6
MPSRATSAPGLEAIATDVAKDKTLTDRISAADLQGGIDAAYLMNDVILEAIRATGVNADGKLTPQDLIKVSNYIRKNPDLYADFVEGHGNDEGQVETGFHLVQGDGGTLKFQGRKFVDTVADAIYHVGFEVKDGRFRNEDGDQNERVDDVAGWLNYYLNGENIVYGTGGNDTLHSGTYSDELADAANELFEGGAGHDKIWAGDGDDRVRGGSGNDESGGGDGNDIMYGDAGSDKLWGQKGNDIIVGGLGNDEMGGGDGNDSIWGQDGIDKLYGDSGNDSLNGGSGNDTLAGGSGTDLMWGGSGSDKIWGGHDNDRAWGGDGDDEIGGGRGNDELWGGAGRDKIWGEEGDDHLGGGDDDDRLGGGMGNDVLSGGAGNDVISGGDGRDVLIGNEGSDELWAGSGDDRVSSGWGNDTVGAGSGNDTVWGGRGRDTIWGDGGNDIIDGGSDDDVLSGGDGNDILTGGTGNDTITGGNGRDIITGGRGADILQDWEDTGARDIFTFASGDTGTTNATRDVIKGFDSGIDKIDLTDFGGLAYQEEAFSANGSGEVRFDGDYVLIDENGDGRVDAEIEVMWVNTLSENDFML